MIDLNLATYGSLLMAKNKKVMRFLWDEDGLYYAQCNVKRGKKTTTKTFAYKRNGVCVVDRKYNIEKAIEL